MTHGKVALIESYLKHVSTIIANPSVNSADLFEAAEIIADARDLLRREEASTAQHEYPESFYADDEGPTCEISYEDVNEFVSSL